MLVSESQKLGNQSPSPLSYCAYANYDMLTWSPRWLCLCQLRHVKEIKAQLNTNLWIPACLIDL